MTQEVILIRGLPGSGKSTLARKLRRYLSADSAYDDWHHRETDMFFCSDKYTKNYIYDASKVGEAHKWCQNEVKKLLQEKENVIVSNTFTQVWEMQPYINMAKEFGARLTVLTCEGQYGSVHDVPEETILSMRKHWEKYPQ